MTYLILLLHFHTCHYNKSSNKWFGWNRILRRNLGKMLFLWVYIHAISIYITKISNQLNIYNRKCKPLHFTLNMQNFIFRTNFQHPKPVIKSQNQISTLVLWNIDKYWNPHYLQFWFGKIFGLAVQKRASKPNKTYKSRRGGGYNGNFSMSRLDRLVKVIWFEHIRFGLVSRFWFWFDIWEFWF